MYVCVCHNAPWYHVMYCPLYRVLWVSVWLAVNTVCVCCAVLCCTGLMLDDGCGRFNWHTPHTHTRTDDARLVNHPAYHVTTVSSPVDCWLLSTSLIVQVSVISDYTLPVQIITNHRSDHYVFTWNADIAGLQLVKVTSCAGGRHNLPPPPASWLWRFDLESGVRVTCDLGYLCANFSLPRPLCSRLRPIVRDRRQTDRRQTCIIA